MLSFKRLLILVALTAGTFAASAASAETIALTADLKGSNEVPPNPSLATGTGTGTFDTSTRMLTWSITFTGLSGPAIGAHFHGPGEAGRNAGIVLPFGSTASPIAGSKEVTETQAADLLAGKWYINIHTERNPGGEIRGQLVK